MKTEKIEIGVPAGKTAKDTRPVTERIKTFEDACKELGDEHPFVRSYNGYAINISEDNKNDTDILAYLKLRIICAAINDGWEAKFTKGEYRYYPWFYLYKYDEIEDMIEFKKCDMSMMNTDDYITEYAGFACAGSLGVPSHSDARFGYRLCLKNKELAAYCGKQFIDIWSDFVLIRK